MGIRDWFVNVTSAAAPMDGFYKITKAGRTISYGVKCSKCHHEYRSERATGGSFNFFCCGAVRSYPFSELAKQVKRTVAVGAPGGLMFLDDADGRREGEGAYITLRQPRRRG